MMDDLPEISEEILRAQFERLIPDMQLCIHAWNCGVVEDREEGELRVGVIARFVAHTANGTLRTYDVLFAETLAVDAVGKLYSALLNMAELKAQGDENT
jgi:hypothetical protein